MCNRLCEVCGTALVCQRSTRRYCANACRQSAYRRRRAPKVWHRRGRARHRLVRPIARQTVSLAQAVVRPIAMREAKRIVERVEPMCVGEFAYGLFIGQALASVVVFGPHPAGNFALGYGQTIALLRGVTLPWAPRNCGSKLIRGAMNQLPPHYASVVAFSDATLGETGTIYRAAGFTCIGASRGRRVLVHYQGKVLSERSARIKFGTASAPRLAALGLKVETVPRRCRYGRLADGAARRARSRARSLAELSAGWSSTCRTFKRRR